MAKVTVGIWCVSKCGGKIDKTIEYPVMGRKSNPCGKCGRAHSLKGVGIDTRDGKWRAYIDRDGVYFKDKHGIFRP